MRKLIRSILLLGATALMLIPVQPVQPVNQVQAMGFYEEYYTVRYGCIIGPTFPSIEGEWTRDCNGNWTGWGWEPGHDCSYTEITYGSTECVLPP